VLSPAFDDSFGLGEAVEDLAVEELVAKFGVEALAIAVLPRRAWLDEGRLRADRCDPLPHCFGDELGTIVRTNMPRHAAQDEEVRQDVNDIGGLELPVYPDRDAFAGKLVDHVQHAELPAIMGAILDKVVGPDMIGMLRSQPHAGSIVQP
jgi:hypothetical protein